MAFKGARLTYLSAKNTFASGAAMKIALLGVLLIPVMFAGFYLSAFYDPYDRLNTVAVAVVNEDEGAVINDEFRNLGSDVCDDLREETDGLQWHFVNAEEAQQGMEDGIYFMSCTIPKDFSALIASADTEHPEKAELVVTYDQSNNMLASQIGGTVWKQVQQTMNSSIIQEYWENVFSKMKDASESLGEAADGAGELADGLGSAVAGNITITSNLRTLRSGAESLDAGLDKLADGSQQVDAGVQSLSSGMNELSSGSSQLNAGLQELNSKANALSSLPEKTQQLSDGAQQVNAGVQEVNTYLISISEAGKAVAINLKTAANDLSSAGKSIGNASAAIRNYMDDNKLTETEGNVILGNLATAGKKLGDAGDKLTSAGNTLKSMTSSDSSAKLQALSAGAAALAAGAEQLNQGIQASVPALGAGVGQLATGSSKLDDGLKAAQSGASQLAANTPALSQGAQSAADGAAKIASGAGALANGSQTLGEGLEKAQAGSEELRDGLADGADQMNFSNEEIDAKAEMMNEPVLLNEEHYTNVDNYGTGFAPFFLGLGIWVGCIFAGFLFKPLNKRLSISGANPILVAFVGYVPLALFAVVQTLIAQLFVQFVLGAHIGNIPAYYGMGILCALVFMAIMQYLVAAFGFPGRFIAVLLLTLQLTSAAGTFPVQMTPDFFQAINPWMPMTYFVEGMRQIMTGIGLNFAIFDAGILVIFGIIFFALTSVVAYRHRTVKMTQIHPLLDL